MNRFIAGPPGFGGRSEVRVEPAPAAEKEEPPIEKLAKAHKWTPRMRDVFAHMSPAALCLVATDGPLSITEYYPGGEVKRRIGHNRGFWPAKIARASAWKDTTTMAHNKLPGVFFGTQARLWFESVEHRARAHPGFIDVLVRYAEVADGIDDLEHDCHDLGELVDLRMVELDMRCVATDEGLMCWDDAEFSAFIADVADEYTRLIGESLRRNRHPIEDAWDRVRERKLMGKV